MNTVEEILEAIKRLDGAQMDELAELMVKDGVGGKLEFLLSVYERENIINEF